MPPNKRPPSSAKSASAREMWLQAIKGRTPFSGSKKGLSSVKKTPNEFWIGSLRKSQGLQNEIASMDTFGENRPSAESVPYLSTSHYLREKVGLEKPLSQKRSASVQDLRAPTGTPAYKTPEEYYDEVLELRKVISTMDKDSSLLRAKLRRVEEDNSKKEKEIESLMDPNKSGDLRRTLTDKKPDSSSVVYSLKQRLMRLEQQLKDKEQTINSLKTDLKSTNIDEVRLKMEMFYQEIMRLKKSQVTEAPKSEPKLNKTKDAKESAGKIKALNDTILRMNEKNVRLTGENKSLKEDLDKVLSQLSDIKAKQNDYEEMSKKQLANMLAKLEVNMESQEPSNKENSSEKSSNPKHKADASGKLDLSGNLADRLQALDKRETELLEEIKHLNTSMQKLRQERQTYRQRSEEKTHEIKALKKEVTQLRAELESFYEKDRITSSRRSSANGKLTPPLTSKYDLSPRERTPSIKESQVTLKQLTPSPTLQSTRPGSRERPSSALAKEHERREKRLREIRENQAARTIQRAWRTHEREAEEAATLIKSTLLGNNSRRRQLQTFRDEEIEEEMNEAAELLQSSIRGHWGRKKFLDTRSRTSSFGSAGYNSDDAAMQIQSALRGHSARKAYLSEEKSITSRPPSAQSNKSRLSLRSRTTLDSAGEDGSVSDEIQTPRRVTKKPSSANRKISKPVVRSQSDNDDDDIMF